MDVSGILGDHAKELCYPILFILISYLLNPFFDQIPEADEIVKKSITLLVIVGILLFIYISTKPNIVFSFHHIRRELILVKDSASKRGDNVNLYSDINESFIFNKIFSFLFNKYPTKFYYQIYWKPKNAMNLDINTDSVDYIEDYPAIPVGSLSNTNEYFLKISTGNMPQCRKVVIKIRKKCEPKSNIFGYILFHLIKIKSERKIVHLE